MTITILFLMCMFLMWLNQGLMDNIKEIEEKIMYIEAELNYLKNDKDKQRKE